MANIKAAEKLGIHHQQIRLLNYGDGKSWKASKTCEPSKVETAALEMFCNQGWLGYPSEGGLILNVIKAASFKPLTQRNRTTYIEALYAQNVAFEEDRYEPDDLIGNIRQSNIKQVKHNLEIMFDATERTEQYSSGGITITSNSGGSIRDYFPDLQPEIMEEFYSHIGNERLAKIAEIFAIDPYEYRKGWPDLTMWKQDSEEIIFREVKTPGDRIRSSQKKIIQDILLPLGYDVGIVDVIS